MHMVPFKHDSLIMNDISIFHSKTWLLSFDCRLKIQFSIYATIEDDGNCHNSTRFKIEK